VFPSNTMWPGPRPTYVLCFIMILPTVWPQYTNYVTDTTDRQTGQTGQDRTGQDRQRCYSIERKVLQTVAQNGWTDRDAV